MWQRFFASCERVGEWIKLDGFCKVLLRQRMFSFDGQKRTRKPPAISTRWIHEKGAARPFQPQSRSRNGKILAASLNVFFSLLHLESLRDGRYGLACSLSAARRSQTDSSKCRFPKRSPTGSCRTATEGPSDGATQKSVERSASFFVWSLSALGSLGACSP